MAPEKTRLKFRVSAIDGVSAAGMPEPHWSEKWGVGLFDYEEFHVTDHLLKLPFQKTTPKTVCIFSIADGALAFRMLDIDRRSEVNGVHRRDAVITTGDKIKIGESLVIEIALAPPKARTSGPVLAKQKEIPKIVGGDGPTLTLATNTATTAATTEFILPSEMATTVYSKPAAKPSGKIGNTTPVFQQEREHSVEIDEPSLKLGKPPLTAPEKFSATGRRPDPSPTSPPVSMRGRHAGLPPEAKIELMNAPHAARDESLYARNDGINPLYPDDVDLSSRLTFGERILSALSKILKRDDLNPVDVPFEEGDGSPARPWVPAGIADPGISRMSNAAYGATVTDVKARPAARPWTPEAGTSSARTRGRALVFLVAAVGALMIAVGIFRIQSRVAAIEEARRVKRAGVSDFEKGVPIEALQDQVRKLRH